MKTTRTLILSALVLLLASCGEQYRAKSLVKDFLNENLEKDYSIARTSKLASTAQITKEKVAALRKEAASLPYMKKGITYAEGSLPDTLFYIRVTYTVKEANNMEPELTQTFYMDKEKTRIVAVKEY